MAAAVPAGALRSGYFSITPPVAGWSRHTVAHPGSPPHDGHRGRGNTGRTTAASAASAATAPLLAAAVIGVRKLRPSRGLCSGGSARRRLASVRWEASRGQTARAASASAGPTANGATGSAGSGGEEELDISLDAEELIVRVPRPGRRSRTGVLLLNIGTPASTSVEDVRDYLARFLADDRVIEIEPPWLKFILLQLLLATRPQNSAENYQRIWDPVRGSPLLFHSEDLAEGLQRELGDEYLVRIGMAYSQPFVEDALRSLADSGVDDVALVPMFPHYASSTTGSILANAYRTASEVFCTPYLKVVPPFYNNALYLAAMRSLIADTVGPRGRDVDHLLFSFHGLPEAQCSQTDASGKVCLQGPNCCARMTRANRNCYRAQCFDTARLLARELGLEDRAWSVGFQSRLTLRGTIQWIRPYTDEALGELARSGVRRLAIVAPSFTADCVETLEELGIQGREQFAEAGGEELVVIPCLNSSDMWVHSLADIVREQLAGRVAAPEVAASETAAGLAAAAAVGRDSIQALEQLRGPPVPVNNCTAG